MLGYLIKSSRVSRLAVKRHRGHQGSYGKELLWKNDDVYFNVEICQDCPSFISPIHSIWCGSFELWCIWKHIRIELLSAEVDDFLMAYMSLQWNTHLWVRIEDWCCWFTIWYFDLIRKIKAPNLLKSDWSLSSCKLETPSP